ncbi:MAG TPA: hypothetical protein VHD60_03320 [Candidatus Saccharimonadales bacterium]|nr:hypothetical protein [Candidatus Saccharimonadales bacterium]
MTAPRSRKETKRYNKHQARIDKSQCSFCQLAEGGEPIVMETNAFLVVRNLFPYSIWDGQRVADHLLVVPRLHTDTLSALAPAQAQEFVAIISEYEKQGYNVYARAPGSHMKSITHQHTHLIKTAGLPKKVVFLLRRPYVRIVF